MFFKKIKNNILLTLMFTLLIIPTYTLAYSDYILAGGENIGIELNTGGYHYGLGEPNPCVNIIRRYHELGGEIITIGADAHTPDKVGYAFDRAADVLRECGFSYYTVFKHRQPVFHKL